MWFAGGNGDVRRRGFDRLTVDRLMVDRLMVDRLMVDRLMVDRLMVDGLMVDRLMVDWRIACGNGGARRRGLDHLMVNRTFDSLGGLL